MFNAISQIPNRIRNGFRHWLGINGYSEWDAALFSQAAWDHFDERLRRYSIYGGYRENVIYFNPAVMSRLQMQRPKLYKNTRGIYNSVDRIVKLYTAEIYGGALDMEEAKTGAIQVDCDDRLRLPITRLWEWSNWQQYKSLFVGNGALYGDAAIKVVDAPNYEMVWLEVLDPRKIVDYEADSAGELTYIEIAYEKWDKVAKREYTYSETITLQPDGVNVRFETFRNGEPYPYMTDVLGTPIASWESALSFIPVTLAQHEVTGMKWGRTAFANLLDKINEINDQASLLNDGTRKTINPLFAALGAKAGTVDLDNSRDGVPVLELPAGTDMKALTPVVDVAAISQHIQTLLLELERDLPELSLHRLREGGNLTAPGVKAAYSDAIKRIGQAKGNYDAALVKAMQFALAIGGLRGYEGFRGLSVDQVWTGDLKMSIKDVPIVEDELTKLEKVQTLQSGGHIGLYLQELGYSEDEIDEEIGREDEKTANAVRGLAAAAFGNTEDDDEDADEDTAEAEVF